MAQPTYRGDSAYKQLFSHRRMAADLVRLLGEPWVDDLDLERMQRLPSEHVAKDLHKRLEDMPWWVPFKPGGGRPAGAGVLLQIEFQSEPQEHMAERLLEYAALLRSDLRRSGWMSADGGRSVLHVPLVVHSGRGGWNAPLRLAEDAEWLSPTLMDVQPRIAYWVLDTKDYAGDDASDGNVARAVLALDGAVSKGLPTSLGRARVLFEEGLRAAFERARSLVKETDDADLRHSFGAWCEGVVRPRRGGALLDLSNIGEMPMSMLAETLREWDERNFNEGRQEGLLEGERRGLLEGERRGLEAERTLLRGQAARRFGDATATELADILADVEDGAELARVGALIIDCATGEGFLAQVRRH